MRRGPRTVYIDDPMCFNPVCHPMRQVYTCYANHGSPAPDRGQLIYFPCTKHTHVGYNAWHVAR